MSAAHSFTRQDVSFASGEDRCAAWLYLPDGMTSPPVVILAVDGTRIAVWGSSFGGGHSIIIAARHPELRAAVAQCPFTDGLASALALGPTESLKALPTVAKDVASMIGRRTPTMIPLAGPSGSVALMNAPDALPGYEALLPPDTTFRHEVAARVAPTIVAYRPGRAAKKIKFPILFCVSNTDTVMPPAQTLRYARTAPRGEIKRYDAGHFDFYLGEPFEALVRDQIEFLTRQLQPAGAVV
jgi:pimeloyl-ACP methyl ester carboxylesterase